MSKKIGLFFGLLLGFCSIGGACIGAGVAHGSEQVIVAHAEGEEAPVEETFECQVVLSTFEHGEISVDKEEGHVGEIVTVTAKHDIFYLIDFVAVNGTNLVESEETSGLFSFALVEGENKITAKFTIDKELLGEMSTIVEQATNKDWTNLFSVENVVRIVSFLLNGGLLIAIIRYFVKDKRLEKKLENKVEDTLQKVLPDTTKDIIIANTKEVLEPIFVETTSYQQEIIRVLSVFIKCFALMQENTPEARSAVLAELSNLKIGDTKVINDAKEFLEKYFAGKMEELNSVLSNLDGIIEKNKEIIEKNSQVVEIVEPKEEIPGEETSEETNGDDGTQF